MRPQNAPVLLLLAVLAAACGDDDPPTGPVGVDPETPLAGAVIDDATRSTPLGLHFLEPLVAEPEPTGALEGELLPFTAVQVCAWGSSGCEAEVERFTHRGTDGERLRLESEGGAHYRVDWALAGSELEAGTTYRIRVLVGPFELGHVNIRIRPDDGSAPQAGPYLVLDADTTLAIRFHIAGEPSFAGLPSLQPAAAEARAGGVIGLEGLDVAVTSATELELYVHGERAPIAWDEDGRASAGVPLFLDTATAWPAPPEASLDLLLFEAGEPVAWARDALRVLPLEEAPGSVDQARTALVSITAAAARIGGALPQAEGIEKQWLFALTGALDSLVHGTGEGTLGAALAALEADAAQLRLMEAWLASSGTLAALEQQAEWLASVAAGLDDDAAAGGALDAGGRAVEPNGGPTPAARTATTLTTSASPSAAGIEHGRLAPTAAGATIVSDVSLARRMQLYEVTKLFGEVVVAGTGQKFSETVGLGAGAIGIVKRVPAVAVTNAVLTVVNFVLNKVIVGLMPAKIDTFELTLTRLDLSPGEITDATIDITASNDPPPIGIQDLVGLILAGLGVPKTPDAQSFADFLQATANFYLSTAQSMLAAYASAHPELNLDVDLVSMPSMQWEATITDPRLVERRSWTPEVIDSVAGQVQWRASKTDFGEGRIYARTASGPEAVLISLPAGVEYNGGAFGDDIRDTEVDTVRVAGDLIVVTDFAPTIEPDGFNALEVRAGYLNSAGDTLWWEGLHVDLVYDGGTVETASGVTDADGQFITLARLDPGSERIIITATVTGILGETVDRTVEASVVTLAAIIPVWNRSETWVAASQNVDDTPSDVDEMVADSADFSGLVASLTASTAGSRPWCDTCSTIATASAEASASQETTFELDPATEYLMAIASSGDVQGSAQTENVGWGDTASGRGTNRVDLVFDVDGAAASFVFTASCTLSDTGAFEVRLSLLNSRQAPLIDLDITDVEYAAGECSAIRVEGTLFPGRYEFEAYFQDGASTDWVDEGGDSDTGGGDYQLRLQLSGT